MKFTKFVLLIAFAAVPVHGNSADKLPKLLTEAEAEAIVTQREEAKEARYEARRQELAGAEVVESKEIQREGSPMTINLIKPLVLEKPSPADTETSDKQPEMTPEQWAAYIEAQQVLIPEQISMGANVYGDEYSEITWRDRETKSELVVWSNVSLNFLKPISTIQTEEYDYMYFGFVTPYTREDEQARIEFAAERGFEVESRWKEPPVKFSEDRYEYVVMANGADVPEKLYRQLDAVLGYYVAHKEELEIEHKNAQTLQEAHEKYKRENPPQPKETLINFWKIEE